MTAPTQIFQGQNIDAMRRQANAIFALFTASGPTAARPTAPAFIGQPYFDTNLGYPVWWTGSAWVNAAGTRV